eukprot:6178053-Pleurochrysis_carterae.AAC.3
MESERERGWRGGRIELMVRSEEVQGQWPEAIGDDVVNVERAGRPFRRGEGGEAGGAGGCTARSSSQTRAESGRGREALGLNMCWEVTKAQGRGRERTCGRRRSRKRGASRDPNEVETHVSDEHVKMYDTASSKSSIRIQVPRVYVSRGCIADGTRESERCSVTLYGAWTHAGVV